MSRTKQVASQSLAIDSNSPGRSLSVDSDSFPAGQGIPDDFSGYGQGRSPELHWSDVPADASSIVVLAEDPDAPGQQPYSHWVLYNLPPAINALPAGVPAESRLPRYGTAMQGRSSTGRIGYFGPHPPKADSAHRYHFEVFALDRMLDVKPGVDRDAIVAAMRGHVLASGEVVGTYQAS